VTPEGGSARPAVSVGQWIVPEIVLDLGGPRSALLIRQAFEEEGRPCPSIDERVAPSVLLFPRSFVETVEHMPSLKTHDYSFVGGLFRPDTFPERAWILDFAERRFSDRSYLLLTDAEPEYTPIGPFDRTNTEPDVFVPRNVPPQDRAYFHDHYFRVLRASQFALCPAGDAPWSMRFFEAILCRSIPIVSDAAHTGRNDLERALGYHYYLREDDHVYDERIVEENFRTFVHEQTLMAGSGRSV
jgi:hypothetical protein